LPIEAAMQQFSFKEGSERKRSEVLTTAVERFTGCTSSLALGHDRPAFAGEIPLLDWWMGVREDEVIKKSWK
jgi:hypothetical protein